MTAATLFASTSTPTSSTLIASTSTNQSPIPTTHHPLQQNTPSKSSTRSIRRRARPSAPSSSSATSDAPSPHQLYSQNPFQDEETTGSLVTQGFSRLSEWVKKKTVPGGGALTAGGSPKYQAVVDGQQGPGGRERERTMSSERSQPTSGESSPRSFPPFPSSYSTKPARQPHRLASSFLPSTASTSSELSVSLNDDDSLHPDQHDDQLSPPSSSAAVPFDPSSLGSSSSSQKPHPQHLLTSSAHRPSSIRTNTNITMSSRGPRQKTISFTSRTGSSPAAPIPTSATASGQTIPNEDYHTSVDHHATRPRRSSITPSFSSPLAHSPSIYSLSAGGGGSASHLLSSSTRPYLSHSTSHRTSQQSLSSPPPHPPDSPGYGAAEFNYNFQPGFQTDDTKSLKTGGQRGRSMAAAKLIRKLGAENTTHYWMPDETAQNCHHCQAAFNRVYRFKHHCRICGVIYCDKCTKFYNKPAENPEDPPVSTRACLLCYQNIMSEDSDDDDQSIASGMVPSFSSYLIQAARDSPLGQSSFSSSQFFGRSSFEQSSNLGAIAESQQPSQRIVPRLSLEGPEGGGLESIPPTPDDTEPPETSNGLGYGKPSRLQLLPHLAGGSGGEGEGERTVSTPAPFRRPIAADEEDEPTPTSVVPTPSSPSLPSSLSPVVVTGSLDEATLAVPSSPDAGRRTIVNLGKAVPAAASPSIGAGGPSSISFPSSGIGEDSFGEGGPILSSPFRPTRFDSNAPLPAVRTRAESRFSYRGKEGSNVSGQELGGGMSSGGVAERSSGAAGGGGGRSRAGSLMGFGYPLASSSQLRPIQLISSSPASMKLLRDLLRQEITRLEIPDASKWMDILLPLLVRAANTVDPNCKLGDAFDIRAFVKVKKIPGGRIKDSEYVDGTVVTKNVAHKAMSRKYKSPRIMILKFPLDYHRIERTIIDIKPVMAQEAQYLAGLVNRIAAVRPHIVLVEKHVARLALEGLLSSNIAVVRSIKEKSLSSIRRVTQADEIASLDKMTLEPRLGRCADLVIQTFDHELIKGRRKTIMRFEGCLPRLGCTLLLRGADLETLKKVKKITYFAIYAIYHLKLEMFMWFDEHGVPPPPSPHFALPSYPPPEILDLPLIELSDIPAASPDVSASLDNPPRNQTHKERLLSKRIYDSLLPYLETTLSISTSVIFPPPFPIARMSEVDTALHELRQARDEEEAASILRDEQESQTHPSSPIPFPEETQPLAAVLPFTSSHPPSEPSASVSIDPSTPTTATHFTRPDNTSTETVVDASDSLRPTTICAPAWPSLGDMLHKVEDVSKASSLSQIEYEHASQLKIWQWFVDNYQRPLVPSDFQTISYLAQKGWRGKDAQATDSQCVERHLERISFYGEGDISFGQWVFMKAASAHQPCPEKSCGRIEMLHYEVISHRETRLQIAMQPSILAPVATMDPGMIHTQDYCPTCDDWIGSTTLSEQAWKMSWGKYLEVAFYPDPERSTLGCPHDHVRGHVRYLHCRGVTIRIHNEALENYEVSVPSTHPHVRAETKLGLKNQEIEFCYARAEALWTSLKNRLNAYYSNVPEEESKAGKLRLALAELGELAEKEHRVFRIKMSEVISNSLPTEVLAMNPLLHELSTIRIVWEDRLKDMETRCVSRETRFLPRWSRSTAHSELDESEHRSMMSETSNDSSSEFEASSSVSEGSQSDAAESGPSLDVSTSALESQLDQYPVGQEHLDAPTSSISPTQHLLHSPLDSPGVESLATPMGSDHQATPSVLPKPTQSTGSYFDELNQPSKYDSDASDSTIPAPPTSASNSIAAPATLSLLTSISPSASSPELPTALPLDEPAAVEAQDPSLSPVEEPQPQLSRIPRRARLSAKLGSIARQFENNPDVDEEEDELESPPGSPVFRRAPIRRAEAYSESEQEAEPFARPPFQRRGRTDGSLGGSKGAVSSRPFGALSDDEGISRPKRASRIPIPSRSAVAPAEDAPVDTSPTDPPLIDTQASKGRLRPRASRAKRTNPPSRSVSPSSRRPPSIHSDTRRKAKPKAVRSNSHQPAGTHIRRAKAATHASSSHVLTLSRQFERLSREAERQKRLNSARTMTGTRRRPLIAVPKTVDKSLSLMEALRDDSDSSSSEDSPLEDADNEHDSADERVEGIGGDKRSRLNSPVPSSPVRDANDREGQEAGFMAVASRGEEANGMSREHLASRLESIFSPEEPSVLQEDGSISSSFLAEDAGTPSSSEPLRESAVLEIIGPFDKTAPLPSLPPTPHCGSFNDPPPLARRHHLVEQSEMSGVSSAGLTRGGWAESLYSFIAQPGIALPPLEKVFSSEIAYTFEDSKVILRSNERTSIIAHVLSSKKYSEKLRRRQELLHHNHPEHAAHHVGRNEEGTEWSVVSRAEGMEHDEASNGEQDHWQEECGTKDGRIFVCRVFFLERFHELRDLCGLNDNLHYIESLSRCVEWESSGGKSGSKFLKTKDDRFVAKELDSAELAAFSYFAPHYFSYMMSCLKSGRPTTLAKILGVYRLQLKSNNRAERWTMNVMILENVYYEKKHSYLYDLKGSTRNRWVTPTNKVGQVLLDANLESNLWARPYYVREYSRRIMLGALRNDAKFLADLNIMDYSLIVGVDDVRGELSCGIVDYIRPYTWDKALETWTKQLGGGKEPTIVTPAQYRTRFQAAMDKYFPLIPDRWYLGESTGARPTWGGVAGSAR